MINDFRIDTPRGVYVHFPFCAHRCFYCDFTAFPCRSESVQSYEAALFSEIELTRSIWEVSPLRSLYIGGGSPSLWAPESVARLVAAFRPGLHPGAEITLECNPGDMRFAHLAALRLAGVNRLSVGAQSSNANALRAIGRRHSWKDVVQVVGDARRAGFENISLDLIYGLPGETLPVIKKTIADALGLGVTHMSVYGLQLEEGTALSGLADSGKVVLPDDDAQAAAYDLAGEMLNHSGFRQYEISNFAIPGCESRHNLIYWRNEPYLGLGPAAVSYIKGTRSTNARALVTYVSDIGAGRRGTAFSETLEPEGARSETMILGLRLNQGVDEESFATRFGAVPEAFYGDLIQELRADGWLRSDRLALTDKARPVASQILLRFV